MNPPSQITITLHDDMVQMVHEKVRAGTYASDSDVVHDALKVLEARAATVEAWLCEEVVATYDARRSSPTRVISIEAVFDGASARRRRPTAARPF